MPRKLRPDMWIFGAVVLLLSAGVVMVYSASAIVAADRFHDPYLFLKKQLVWALLGAGCLLVALRIDYRRLERLGWPVLLAAAVALAVLILAQPDLGNCLTLVAVTFALLYLAGSPVRYLGFIVGAALPFLALAIWLAPYRLRRITTFLDPWSDPRGSGFQIIQSWLALGSGGLLGRGIGESKQQLFSLPDVHPAF